MLFYDDRIALFLLFVFFVLLFGGGWELSKLQKSLICGGRYPSLTLLVYRIGRVLLAYICSVYSSHNFVIFIYVLYIKSVHLIDSIVVFFQLTLWHLMLYFVLCHLIYYLKNDHSYYIINVLSCIVSNNPNVHKQYCQRFNVSSSCLYRYHVFHMYM